MDNNNFKDIFKSYDSKSAIVWNEDIVTYTSLVKLIEKNKHNLYSFDIKAGSVIALIGDFSPVTIGLLFSLIELRCIIVPLNRADGQNKRKLYDLAEVDFVINVNEDETISVKSIDTTDKKNSFYIRIIKKDVPGLVLFSSGTSGEPKAAVHDFSKLLKKFYKRKTSLKTLNFLLFDHWGGLNTMFHILSNGGTLISVIDRRPKTVCKLIEHHNIELLPVSPTFLNLLIISKSYKDYDLTSLKIISYGTEPMPKHTLRELNNIFPDVRFIQTYGLIELGVMNSKSKSNDSLWVKVGGEGYETRIVNEILHIKADSAMMGYLNAPSPFTEDGWFITGDKVQQKGEYIKILGRESEIINVGGEKVYPQEVENCILKMKNIKDVIVFGKTNPITGKIVCAKVELNKVEDKKLLIKRVKKFCKKNLEVYKVPVKIYINDDPKYGSRFKKIRNKD
tara:strand:+ start:1181 stop:2530 length:1350 start_codon:yes stop_codon:yes gene_type:complete